MSPVLPLVPWLAAGAAALFAIRLVLFAALHLVPGGVHPVRHAVSDYAASPQPRTRRLATAASWSMAGAWVVLGAAVLADSAGAGGVAPAGLWMLVLGAVLALMPLVPTDLPDAPTTLRGRVHLLMAIAWFTISYSEIGPMRRMLGGSALGGAVSALGAIAAVGLAALIISRLVPALRTRTFGISERVFILAVTLAPLLLAIGLAAG
ncbi:DUF998 domain-containing protein [Brachybacterium phenoliresistens]|uniref:DUF998 domain-containing protein n=1 Tax=Brachybacterium phenoliresistens TaxID=396014 RepID=UPI0031E00664